jgi:hypothetical protein
VSKENDINVAWELPAGGVVPMVLSQRPDVVVLDYSVTDPAGAGTLCEVICDTVDECRVLVLVERRALVQGIRQLAAGEFVLDRAAAEATQRERSPHGCSSASAPCATTFPG